jgi:hypothetical protein
MKSNRTEKDLDGKKLKIGKKEFKHVITTY